jgi:Ras-related GTP-binding protein C/D
MSLRQLIVPDEYAQDPMSKILLLGPKKSGKSSILKTLFSNLPAHETIYLEPTLNFRLEPRSKNKLINFRFAEIGGSFHWDEKEQPEIDNSLFSSVDTVILVIDSSDEGISSSLSHALVVCKRIIIRALKVNQKINISLFLHKFDRNYRYEQGDISGSVTRADQKKTEFMMQLKSQLTELLVSSSISPNSSPSYNLSIFCTSIFDNSLKEAFSTILQRSLLKDGKIENLLDLLTSSSNSDKSYLIDKNTKLVLASDNSADPGMRIILGDILDLFSNMGTIYGKEENIGSSLIGLSTEQSLYLKMLDDDLGLVTLIRENHLDRIHLINRNIQIFFEALQKILRF